MFALSTYTKDIVDCPYYQSGNVNKNVHRDRTVNKTKNIQNGILGTHKKLPKIRPATDNSTKKVDGFRSSNFFAIDDNYRYITISNYILPGWSPTSETDSGDKKNTYKNKIY